ncbi:MAG: glycosyltransferase 87 family protein [Gemmatimonadaceae bacterium]
MKRLLWGLGALNFLALLAHAGLSWFEAGAATYSERPHGQIVFYSKLGERVADMAGAVAPSLIVRLRSDDPTPPRAGVQYPPADREDRIRRVKHELRYAIAGDWIGADWFLDVYGLPLIVSTLFALGALWLVARTPVGDDPATPRLIRRWAIAFVVVMGFAMPVLVPDFWLSFAWGRTLWWGGNPYYEVPAAAVEGLPFDAPILKMTYGPLWAIISWIVAAGTKGSVLWSTILFKALLVSSWVGILYLVHRLTSERSSREQALALVVTGWLPLGVVQTAGDGHNDALMLLCILAWLYLGERGHPRWATVALALSVSIKYVSAPLFLLDLLRATPAGLPHPTLMQRVRAWIPSAVIAVVVWVVTFAPFFQSLSFFGETTAVREGYFYLPADAVKAIGTMLGVNLFPVALLVQGVFPLATLACLWRYWRAPSRETLRLAIAGIMLSVVFVAAGHVWPWYALWLTVPAALLAWDSLLSRWSLGVLIGAPFPLMVWTAYPNKSEFERFHVPSLVVYTFALVWMVVGWRVFQERRAGNTERGAAE